jgi:CubicO group peptidase (beta-lactamase class C family)
MKFSAPVKAGLGLVGGAFLLLAILVAGSLIYGNRRQREYNSLADTHDLKTRIAALGNVYIEGHSHASLVIAYSSPSNSFFQGFAKTNNPPSKTSIYEIGSITKLFTAALLQSLVDDGTLSLTNTLPELLPAAVPLPLDCRGITLEQLATHTAGLPRMPDKMLESARDPLNPYAAYGTNELYAALKELKLQSAPGAKMAYSNFGYGLLGHLLELKTGTNYASLLRSRILDPLGLNSTWINLPAELKPNLVQGHDGKGSEVPHWDFDALAPAGALKSTAEDLVRFSRANLDPDKPLHRIFSETHKIRFMGFGGAVGLGWHMIKTLEGPKFLWHNGGTGGFVAFIGLDQKHGNSIIILSNSGDSMELDASVDKMGIELLKLGSKISLE